MVTSGTLYGYNSLAFNLEVAGSNPTEGVWSWPREKVLKHTLQEVFYSLQVKVSNPGKALHNKWCKTWAAKARDQNKDPQGYFMSSHLERSPEELCMVIEF